MVIKRIYEAMFLFDSVTGRNSEKVQEVIERLMERSGSELITHKVWEERRLAYEIDNHTRGVYVLSYFKAQPEKINQIETDISLAENIIRALILKRDKMTEEDAQKITDAIKATEDEEISYDEQTQTPVKEITEVPKKEAPPEPEPVVAEKETPSESEPVVTEPVVTEEKTPSS